MTEKLSQMRKDALEIFYSAVKSAAPETAVNTHIKRTGSTLIAAERVYELKSYEKIIVVGAGKAAASMAKAIEEMLGEYVSSGIIIVKYGHGLPLEKIKVIEAGHPKPDEKGHEGAKRIAMALDKATQKDLVISLISGGGSALLPMPADGISLKEKQQTTSALLDCGANIHEMNAIRKHLSCAKGGGLARLAYPAPVINLMLSDVIGDDTDVIASGPFVPDTSTFMDAMEIIRKYGLSQILPANVMKRLSDGAAGIIPETPKPGDLVFENILNLIIGSNISACMAAEEKARSLGYNTLILSSMIEGDTSEVARMHVAIAKESALSGNPLRKPACIISGGETTVVVKGSGLGGRNQEFALVSAIHMAGLKESMVLLSGGTDGTDGPTDAAGGIVDPGTIDRGISSGLDAGAYLESNDSYNYLMHTGDLIMTGPTRTNVMDIRLVLIS